MICRLCLNTTNESDAVFLFETNDRLDTELVTLISKFLQLEIMRDDTISTAVCSECCDHLEDFYGFWKLVEQKQSTLKKEFLNVDCIDIKWTDAVEMDELPLVSCVEIDEKPLDMNNICLLSNVLDVNVDSVELQPAQEQLHAARCLALDDDNFFDSSSSSRSNESLCDSSIKFKSAPPALDGTSDSTDDEEPLVNLKKKLTPKLPTPTCTSDKVVLKKELSIFDENILRGETGSTTTADQARQLQAAIERKPKGCSRAQLSELYDEIIASYMAADCDLCDFQSTRFSELKVHFSEVHKREAYLKCCNKLYSRGSKLIDHIRRHMNPNLFTCSICNKTLNSQDYLQTHIQTVHNKSSQVGRVLEHACPKCDKTFTSERRLENHLLKHDKHQLDHNCTICCKSFANIHRLRRHIQSIHDDVHPHVCDICGKKFKFKPSFDRHLLEHQGVVSPAMQCAECGVWLKNEHSLRLHRFTHDNRDTICMHCNKTCSSRTALRAHIKYAHKLQANLQCTYCDKHFKQQRNLEEHIAIHTGLQLYNCPHCPKECRSRSNMYVHVKQRHADEWLKAKMARSHNPQFKPNDER